MQYARFFIQSRQRAVAAAFEKYPRTKKLQPFIDKYLRTKKGETRYVPLKDGDEIDLGNKKLTVKTFPGHTPGSITLLDPALRFIYTGDASDMDIWMFTNPDCSLHEYAETGRRYYKEVKALGYTKYRGSHVPITHDISYIQDYAEWMDRLTPEKALLRFRVPGGKSRLCIAAAPSLRHFLYTSVSSPSTGRTSAKNGGRRKQNEQRDPAPRPRDGSVLRLNGTA